MGGEMRRLTQAEILDLLDRVEARSKALEAFRTAHSYEAIGRDFGVHPKTVTKWVMRHGGIDAIRGEQ